MATTSGKYSSEINHLPLVIGTEPKLDERKGFCCKKWLFGYGLPISSILQS